MAVKFRYVGFVSAHDEANREALPGIPARDLTDEDVAELSQEQLADVAASRIYEAAGKATKPAAPDAAPNEGG